jgi:hypothetical protein
VKIKFSYVVYVLTLLLGLSSPLQAQTTTASDPNDALYSDLNIWHDRGYTGYLSPLRPYPLQVIRRALQQVVARGDAESVREAQMYLKIYGNNGSYRTGVSVEGATDKSDYYARTGLTGWMDTWFSNYVTSSARLDVFGLKDTSNSNPFLEPAGQTYPVDVTSDNAYVGSVTIRPTFLGDFAVGTSDFYVHGGVQRADYGPFWTNGVFLGAQAPEDTNYAVSWHNGLFNADFDYQSIPVTDSLGNQVRTAPNKQLYMHSYGIRPTDWFDFRFVETVTTNKSDLYYAVPLSSFFINNLLAGDGDKSKEGVTLEFSLPQQLRLNLAANLDDADFNNLVKGNFNTKLKIGVQTGLSWTPMNALLRQLNLDYTAVTPFTYTHESFAPPGSLGYPNNFNQPNYLVYTGANGVNLGPDLLPNSDRIQLLARFQPLCDWYFTFLGRFIRHGDANAGTPSQGWTTALNQPSNLEGGLYDPGLGTQTSYQFVSSNPFLSQPVLELVLVLQLQARYVLDFGNGFNLTADPSYAFQQTWNKNLVKDQSETLNTFGLSVAATLSY